MLLQACCSTCWAVLALFSPLLACRPFQPLPNQHHQAAGLPAKAARNEGVASFKDKNEDQLDSLLGGLAKLRASQLSGSAGREDEFDDEYDSEYEEGLGEEGVEWEWWRADTGQEAASSGRSQEPGGAQEYGDPADKPAAARGHPEDSPVSSSDRSMPPSSKATFAAAGSQVGRRRVGPGKGGPERVQGGLGRLSREGRSGQGAQRRNVSQEGGYVAKRKSLASKEQRDR